MNILFSLLRQGDLKQESKQCCLGKAQCLHQTVTQITRNNFLFLKARTRPLRINFFLFSLFLISKLLFCGHNNTNSDLNITKIKPPKLFIASDELYGDLGSVCRNHNYTKK